MAVVTSTSDPILPITLKRTNIQRPHGTSRTRQPLAHASCARVDARNVPADVGSTHTRKRFPRQTQRRDAPVAFLVAAPSPEMPFTSHWGRRDARVS